MESSDVQPLKKTPPIDILAIKSKPPLFDGFPHLIHHRSTSRNTPVSRANELPAQTPQPKKWEAVKLGSSAGATCLGEYSFLQYNVSSSRETATVGSKKRKLLPTKFLMELDLENEDEPSTAPPRSSVNPSNSWTCTQLHESTQQHKAVLPQGLNHQYRVQPQGLYRATPSSVLP